MIRHDVKVEDYAGQLVKIAPGSKVPGVVDFDTIYEITHVYTQGLTEPEFGLAKRDDSYAVRQKLAQVRVPSGRVELTYWGVRPQVDTLLLMRDFELDETLMDVNNANMRQLMREALKQVREYKSLASFYNERISEYQRKENKLRDLLDGDDDDY